MANTKKGKKKAEAAALAEEECETEEQFVTLATVKAMLAVQESAFKSSRLSHILDCQSYRRAC